MFSLQAQVGKGRRPCGILCTTHSLFYSVVFFILYCSIHYFIILYCSIYYFVLQYFLLLLFYSIVFIIYYLIILFLSSGACDDGAPTYRDLAATVWE
jgi:hypothetical protein